MAPSRDLGSSSSPANAINWTNNLICSSLCLPEWMENQPTILANPHGVQASPPKAKDHPQSNGRALPGALCRRWLKSCPRAPSMQLNLRKCPVRRC